MHGAFSEVYFTIVPAIERIAGFEIDLRSRPRPFDKDLRARILRDIALMKKMQAQWPEFGFKHSLEATADSDDDALASAFQMHVGVAIGLGQYLCEMCTQHEERLEHGRIRAFAMRMIRRFKRWVRHLVRE